MQKLIVGLAALIVAGALAGGAWWLAAERGWIAGKPNSPRTENFQRTLDDYLRRTTYYYNRPCAPAGAQRPQDGMGPKDVRWDWTPASFRAVVDPRRPSHDQSERRYAYFAKQGFFAAQALPEGAIEYQLTWKGMAASTGQGCFAMAEAERAAEVLSFARKRVEHGVEVYEAVARVRLTKVEPWAEAPEFHEIFGKAAFQRHFEPQPVAYEMARGERGFEVIAEQGRPVQVRTTGILQPAVIARLAGGLTPERVKAAVEAWAAGPGAPQLRLCLHPPERAEADESAFHERPYPLPPKPLPPTFTVYNLLARQPHDQGPLRGYLKLRQFESLGFARAELLPAASFQDRPAAGAVRFTLEPAFLERYARERDRCYPVGSASPVEVVKFDPILETNLTPQFLARAAIKPWDEEAKKLIEALPHLRRMNEVGGVLRGTLQYYNEELRVAAAHAQFPMWQPDPAEAKLPAVEPPPQKPAPAVRIAPPARTAPTR